MQILVSIFLILLPVLTFWWTFFPIAFISAFIFHKPHAVLVSGFLLDLFYYSGFSTRYPWFTISALCVFALFTLFKDKIRF